MNGRKSRICRIYDKCIFILYIACCACCVREKHVRVERLTCALVHLAQLDRRKNNSWNPKTEDFLKTPSCASLNFSCVRFCKLKFTSYQLPRVGISHMSTFEISTMSTCVSNRNSGFLSAEARKCSSNDIPGI